MTTRSTLGLSLVLLALTTTGTAQSPTPPASQQAAQQSTTPAQSANRPKVPLARELSRERQIEILMGTAPAAVSEAASLWIVKPTGGYEQIKQGTNGYGCLIQSNRFPRCDDAEGVATIFPVIFHVEDMRVAGKSEAEISASVADGYRTGKFRVPKPGGLCYMLSSDPQSVVPPHVMYAMPYATRETLGYTADRRAGMGDLQVSILDAGKPDAHVVIMTPHWKPQKKSEEKSGQQ